MAIVGTGLIVSACGSPSASDRTFVAVISPVGVAADGLVLELTIPTCNGDPQVELLGTDSESVRLRVVSTPSNGDSCLDVVKVELPEPLADRVIIDAFSGAELGTSRSQ